MPFDKKGGNSETNRVALRETIEKVFSDLENGNSVQLLTDDLSACVGHCIRPVACIDGKEQLGVFPNNAAKIVRADPPLLQRIRALLFSVHRYRLLSGDAGAFVDEVEWVWGHCSHVKCTDMGQTRDFDAPLRLLAATFDLMQHIVQLDTEIETSGMRMSIWATHFWSWSFMMDLPREMSHLFDQEFEELRADVRAEAIVSREVYSYASVHRDLVRALKS